jgi:hypothetical protein
MESESAAKARIKELHEEMDAIHRANLRYWKQGESHGRAARAEHEGRQKRLDEIRIELTEPRSS